MTQESTEANPTQPSDDALGMPGIPGIRMGSMPRAIYDPPATPLLLSAEGDFSDDVAFRHYLAQHAASQTLSLQRTEWYAKSTRTMMIFFTALAVIGIIAGVIIGIVAAVDLHSLTQPSTDLTGTTPFGG